MSEYPFEPQERWAIAIRGDCYRIDDTEDMAHYEARLGYDDSTVHRAYVVSAEQWEAMVAERCAECGHAARGEILNGIYACQYCVLVESKNLCDEIINSKQADLTAARERIAELEVKVQSLLPQAEHLRGFYCETCEHCGAKISSYPSGCPGCGAPQCCQPCCDLSNAKARIAALESRPTPDWAYSVICAVRTYVHCNVGDMNTYEEALRHAARQIPDNFERATTPEWAIKVVKAVARHKQDFVDIGPKVIALVNVADVITEMNAALADVPEDVRREAKEAGI